MWKPSASTPGNSRSELIGQLNLPLQTMTLDSVRATGALDKSLLAVIRSVEAVPLRFPLEPPFRAAVRVIDSVDVVLLRIRDGDGREGLGLAFAFGSADARPILEVARTLGASRVGRDAATIERHWLEMRQLLGLAGAGGPAIAALSAIDMALWDLFGRISGQPLWRLLGGVRERIATYGSGGSLALSTEELVRESASFVEAGHRAIKIKAGHGVTGDLERVSAVRECVGPGVRIAVDGNQQWRPKAAIRWARELEPLDIWWLEEPVRAGDFAGHAEVRAGVSMDVATGETLFGVDDAVRCIQQRATDILMPNLQRIGGITGWRKIAAFAELSDFSMAAHVYPEVHAHLMCATPNAMALELWPDWPWLWTEPLLIEEGHAKPPAGPGLGLTLDEPRVQAYRVDA